MDIANTKKLMVHTAEKRMRMSHAALTSYITAFKPPAPMPPKTPLALRPLSSEQIMEVDMEK